MLLLTPSNLGSWIIHFLFPEEKIKILSYEIGYSCTHETNHHNLTCKLIELKLTKMFKLAVFIVYLKLRFITNSVL